MSSAIDEIKCPRCKMENCIRQYYGRTGEESVNCPECGFHYSFFYKTDSKGNFALKDKTKGTEWSNLIPEEKLIENPFGAFIEKKHKGWDEGGTLETEDDYQKFVSDIVRLSKQDDNMKEVIVSRFLDGEIKKEVVFSNRI